MRSRLATAVTLVFLPIIIFLFAIGWSLYFLGLSEKPVKAKRKPHDDGITITTAIEEQQLQEYQI